MIDGLVAWLIQGAVGPAAVGVSVTWAADMLAGSARRWFRRFRRNDDLSRLVIAAAGDVGRSYDTEFRAVRRLLGGERTWSLAGQGTVEDLAAQIGSCLPLRKGRTGESSHAAAMAIARGLLEFTVADLDPRLFQQVLLTRLQRMETGQASAMDEVLLGLHADLVTRLDAHGEVDARRFASMMERLRRVLDRLPPGPAAAGRDHGVSKDADRLAEQRPVAAGPPVGGPVLAPAAIERKLRVASAKTAAGGASEQDLDADDLAQRCRRLVVLGGPGSGKTWLAKRTARRRAEEALAALAVGGSLDEIELPLYTTCSRLFSAEGDIRTAAVSSALDQLGDLGSSRLSAALREFFTERNEPVVLVIDSLDEAHGSGERLRQADTLPWRVILTSRPSSWNHQLAIEEARQLPPGRHAPAAALPRAMLSPSFSAGSLSGRSGETDLAAQIARRPGLQQAATVPLILAFYCIVGGSEPLPAFRRDLYAKVLNRMLTGRWRGS